MTGAPAEDRLVLVDAQDREIGSRPKTECHLGDGVLHRAFSVFLFNQRGDVLIQKRAAGKMLWPGFWSNSCCSHPRPGETVMGAARRRVQEELAVNCRLVFLYKFQYQARYGTVGAEHELCYVYAGDMLANPLTDPVADPAEIAEWRWVAPAALTREIAVDPAIFSPWMKLEWARIDADHLGAILADRTNPDLKERP